MIYCGFLLIDKFRNSFKTSFVHNQSDYFLLIFLNYKKAAVLCVKSLSDSIEASRRQTMALQRSNSEMSIMSEIPSTGQTNLQTDFLVESSNHFSINRLDLHICEGKSAILSL